VKDCHRTTEIVEGCDAKSPGTWVTDGGTPPVPDGWPDAALGDVKSPLRAAMIGANRTSGWSRASCCAARRDQPETGCFT